VLGDEAPLLGLAPLGLAPLGLAPLGLDGEAPLLGLDDEAPLLELAPPEAEPDFVLSLGADPLMPEEELDEELGELGLVDEAPPDGDEDGAPEEGEELELEEPGLDGLLLVLSPRSHAARPKASATAAARMESFMCPPWLGYKRQRQQIARPA
jgi:hypothetical protein